MEQNQANQSFTQARMQQARPQNSNVNQYRAPPVSPIISQPSQMGFDELKKKKEKIEDMKNLLNLKRKIYALINMGKPEEAKQTYDTLYLLYQKMLKSHNPEEMNIIKNAVAEVYSALGQAIDKKKVKKGHFTEVDMKNKDEKFNRTKVVTTDLDIIMQIVEEKGKINISEIEARFNISKRLAEEWIQILADYGLVEIKYLPIGGVEISRLK